MNIVVLDGYAENPGDLSWDGLKEMGAVTVYPRTAPDEVVARAQEADAVLTNKVVLDSTNLPQLPRLRYIGVTGTGYNVVDVEQARRQGIVVTNVPAYSTESVVQMTFAHILNIVNRVDAFARDNRDGRWSRNADFCYWDSPLHELAGKTMGIVGLGNIGSRVARLAADFGMSVLALTSKAEADLPEFVHKSTLDGLLTASDILSLHCPLTADTRHLVNRDNLAKMKPTAILINTGRGPLVDEQAVADALSAGRLAAYGADVMAQEPPRADNPLLSQPHAWLTPHVAWATAEARGRLMQVTVDNVRAFAEGHPVNVVN